MVRLEPILAPLAMLIGIEFIDSVAIGADMKTKRVRRRKTASMLLPATRKACSGK